MTRLRMVVLGGIYLLCAGLPMCLAASPSIPIEGTMLVTGWAEASGEFSYFMDGASDAIVPTATYFDVGDMSPDTTKIAYCVRTNTGWFLANKSEVWVANLDGSDAVNLTGPYGLGGVNCIPVLSPDGSMIAFQHAVPEPGQRTCEAGFQIWLMNADGTDLHPWLDSPQYSTWWPSWEPDGYRLRGAAIGATCFTADVTGMNLTMLPGVAGGAQEQWSRNGSKLAYIAMVSDTVGGEPGMWRQLRAANTDGSSPQVLVEQFVSDADIATHMAKHELDPATTDWPAVIRSEAGPSWGRWAPMGDKLAFTAALPFDPNGPYFVYQEEVWLYDLTTQEVTRLTDNSDADSCRSWAGPNTSSTSPTVTVGDTTVTFSQVDSEGWTSVVRDTDPPQVPTGFQFDYEFYELNTTAEVTGPVTICMTYTDEEVPPGAEADLAILHYDEAQQIWEDITTSRDPVDNIVCGETDSLSLIALHGIRTTRFPDVPAWGFGTEGLDPHWAYYHVMACVEAGVACGYGDGTYQPTVAITRDQMAVYIARAMAGGDDNVPEFTDSPTFPDAGEGFWALDYVEYAVAQNVVAGYLDGYYHPWIKVDRGQMAVYVARARGWVGIDDDMTTAPELFPDVPAGFWSGTAIEACVTNEVVQGYQDGTYRPEYIVTRDQMAVYVARAFGLVM